MKSKIIKMVFALGCAVSIAAISIPAQAHYRCCNTQVYAYKCNGYYRYDGRPPFYVSGDVQGRPVKLVDGNLYFVQKCTKGYYTHYWSHHHKHYVWHRPCCK